MIKKKYHSIKINKDLLNFTDDKPTDLKVYHTNSENDTLPKGKCTGIYFIPYNTLTLESEIDNICHIEIRIEDTNGHLLARPSDIRDFYHKQGGYQQGFKKIDFDFDTNEKIDIKWKTYGKPLNPICGEFVFIIEEDCTCSV